MNWTKEQHQAITLRNKNILVAAAAGSGKTAVLVERIKRLILEDRCPIDRMLIVTFTNAAAAEMKEKIYKAIHKAIEDIAGEGEKSELTEKEQEDMLFLKRQLQLLPISNISTFHAFALEMIKKYFYIIDVEPNFKICDDAQQSILRAEAMDQLLEELFESKSQIFYDFLYAYSSDRNENRLKEMIDKVYTTIQSLPEPYVWLHDKVEILRKGRISENPAFDFLWNLAERKVKESLEAIVLNRKKAASLQLDQAVALCEDDMIQIKKIEEKLGEYQALRDSLAAFKLSTLRKNYFTSAGDAGEQLKVFMEKSRNRVKKSMKDLYQDFFFQDQDEMLNEMAMTYDDAKFLEEVVLRYGQLYSQKKKEKNLVDFNDIEHYAYEILKDPQVSGFYREKFYHIFVDEYQDSNVIQEALIDRIKRENNLFLVGDVKQSIYKFRLAEPEIFQRRYRAYAGKMEQNSEKIDLNKNFRSKKPIIDFVNQVFSHTMEDYDEAAALHLGDPHGEIFYDEPKLYLTETPWTDEEDVDEELKNIIKAEKEALAAVKIIKDSLGQPYFDSKEEKIRLLSLKDIVILMRGVRNYGDIFYQVLTENQIAAYVDDNDGYFDTMEINTFLSLLSIIDNRKQDIPLLTVLRSEIFGFSVEALAEIRMTHQTGSYDTAFVQYSRAGRDDTLREKCARTLESVKTWQEMAVYMPLEELIWKLMLETGFYIAMGAMPGGRQRQANLRALVDKALNFRKAQGGSVYGFIGYIEAVKERKVAGGQVKLVGEGDDLVRIMTIHKSKGLEFPMVILAGFCKRLNYTSMGKSLVIHKDLGLGFPIVNHQQHWFKTTALQNIMKEKFHQEEVEEEKRILYVALTRPKDRLAILGICNDVQADLDKIRSEGAKDTSYFTMTGNQICMQLKKYEVIQDQQLVCLAKSRQRRSSEALKWFAPGSGSKSDLELRAQVRRQMEFIYPGESELKIKSKYSVSELNSHGRKPVENLEEPASFKAREVFSAVQRGTIYHCLLEHLDFTAAFHGRNQVIKETINQLIADKFLTEEEAAVIEENNILRLLDSPLGRRLAESPAVHRERQFNLIDQVEGNPVIVQGVIDCYFQEEDQLVLVDYKTSRIREGKEIEAEKRRIASQYETQISIYKKALETVTGMKVKDAYIYLTNCGELVEM